MDILYKYCPTERIDILENLKIRLTQPVCFNDPFEAHANVISGFDELEYETAKKYYNNFQGSKKLTPKKEDTTRAAIERNYWAYNQLKNVALNKMGVISMSANYDNPVMWGRYADNARGFVIGLLPIFNIVHENNLLIQFAEKVIYQNAPSKLDMQPFFKGDYFHLEKAFNQCFRKFLLTKSEQWSHENEYRIMSQLPSDTTLIYDNNYPVHLISFASAQIFSIIAGPNSSRQLNEKIISLANNLDAEFYHIFKSVSSYNFGVWDENEYKQKIEAFSDKNNIAFNHPANKDLL